MEKEGSTKPESAAEHDSTAATKAGVSSEEAQHVYLYGPDMFRQQTFPVVRALATHSSSEQENARLANMQPDRSMDKTTGVSEEHAPVDPVLLQSVASYLEHVSVVKGRFCSRSRINSFL